MEHARASHAFDLKTDRSIRQRLHESGGIHSAGYNVELSGVDHWDAPGCKILYIIYMRVCVCVLYLRNLSANLANGYMTNLAAIELAPHNLVQRKPPKITTKTQTEFNYNMTHIKIFFGSDKII